MSGERGGLDRREAIRRLVGAGLAPAAAADLAEAFAAAGASRDGGTAAVPYRPRFFGTGEYETLAGLAALVIPTDETPGAREARVSEWIDFFVGESDAGRQRIYRDGLAQLDRRCREKEGRAFPDLEEAARVEALRDLAVADPAFFRALKEDTVFGFYTSEVGLRELGVDGHRVHSECPGCTHPARLDGTPAVPGEGRPRDPR